MPDRIAVTGGAGYLGTVLVRSLLESGFSVDVIDRLNWGASGLLGVWRRGRTNLHRVDIARDDGLVGILRGAKAVIHLAALVGEPLAGQVPDEAKRVNIDGTTRLMKSCTEAGVDTVVFASTCSNYGRVDQATLADEEHPLQPLGVYAESKVEGEHIVLSSPGPNHKVVCRFATLHGVSPRMRFDLTVNHFTRDAVVKQELEVWDPTTARPYIDVEDAAQAVLSLLRWCLSGTDTQTLVVNVGSQRDNLSKADIVEAVTEALPATRVTFRAEGVDERDYRVSYDRLSRTIPDWSPKYSVGNSIDEMVELLTAGVFPDPMASLYRNDEPKGIF